MSLGALSLALCRAVVAQSIYTPYYFVTLAGSYGSQEGPDPTVQVSPTSVAADNRGDLYFSEGEAIFEITPDGFTSRYAGLPNTTGSSDGPRESATFNQPMGIAVDDGGNVYVADSRNNTIRKITPEGLVSTLAGTPGVTGRSDGQGGAALFSNPEGVAVDGAGNVYVADYSNCTIREISPSGLVTTLAGTAQVEGAADGTGPAAQFYYPGVVAVDPSGNVYVADTWYGLVRMVTPAGVVTTLLGKSGEGAGRPDGFNAARSVAVDPSGDVFVADEFDSFWEITPEDTATVLAGGTYGVADGTGSQAEFIYPRSVAVGTNGIVYVADQSTIRTVTQGGVVTTLVGFSGTGSADGTGAGARFNNPEGVAVDAGGYVYVSDTTNETIRKITPDGLVTTLAGTLGVTGMADGTGAAAQFNGATGVAVDTSGNLYVADSDNDTIRKISPGGVVSTLAGTARGQGSADGTGPAAQFYGPTGIAVDASGNVYVSDTGNATIRKITPGGVVTTLAGTAGVSGSADGTGAAAQFASLSGIAVDASGNLYVADRTIPAGPDFAPGFLGNTIRKVTPGGVVTTLAGTPGLSGSVDGTGPAAQFQGPNGVAVDAFGNVYVTETSAVVLYGNFDLSQSHTIRKITPGGVVTTIAGSSASGFADGLGAQAEFITPFGIAVDGKGNVFVSDTGNDTIREGAFSKAPSLASEPSFSSPPSSQTLATGGTVVFSVSSDTLPAPSYQWYLAGAPIAGATQPSLVVSDATGPVEGDYDCVATNALGAATSASTLSVVDAPEPGRLINLSCRALVGDGANVLIAGFVVGGGGTSGDETLLVRASGPALLPFGVTGVLPDPELQLTSSESNSLVAANSGWGGDALISAAAAAVGAFPWADATSHDSALVETLASGPYTALVAGAAGDSGIALAELYDATPAGAYLPATPRLINISARTQVGQGANALIAGFVIGGTTSKTVLIRASGPALAPLGFPVRSWIPNCSSTIQAA